VVRKIETRSVSETQQLQSALRERMTGEHTGGAQFKWRATHVALGEAVISSSAYTGSVRARTAEVGKYWLSITTASGGRVVQGGETATYAAESGNILSPGMAADIELGDGFQGLLVGVPVSLVERALAVQCGRAVAAPRFALAVDYRGERGPAAEVARLVRFLADEADRGSALVSVPAIAARLEEALVHAMLQLPHDGAQPAGKVAAFALDMVRRVEDYLAAHAADPVTLSELAQVAGAGIRTVQAAFHRHRGYAPMAFLRARRFDLARARLASDDVATIAEIAFDCGFTHLGRFSTAYRTRFGERPTDTRLRRSGAGSSARRAAGRG
jgi:AraC-like DNA-binding protein